ncbi:uncharacterized protein [Elaeis guineensis]|uniref:QWRF motif-containing protein 3 n=1 Tax=Elaeis guineensis var. tenera TaxID=51953 RepID=A0A8N4IAJ4_ELAGV|nr:QWRF motif-containing protein 3 [Elaeis guineensis]
MEKRRPRRTGSRDVSSRFLLSPASSPASDAAGNALSPLRRRSISDPPGKLRFSAASSRGLWPSSRKPGTLADHLGNDRLIDLAEQNAGNKPASTTTAASPQSIIRQRSCSEFSRFDDKDETEKKGRRSKENLPIGASMRYIGKIHFPPSPKPGSPSSPSSAATLALTPGRISVDEKALPLRRKSDFGLDYPSSESDRSETKIATPRIPKSDAARVAAAKAIGRASSMTAYGSASTQWALSPGRSGSPTTVAVAEGRAAGMGRSFSNLRPPSPRKGRKVGDFISMGLDLFHFRKRSFSGSSTGGGEGSSPTSSSSYPSLVVGSPTAGGVGVMGHQFRLMHNRLIQWRYANARTDAVNRIGMANSESTLVMGWAEVTRLQSRVVQKRLKLERERLALKLNTLLSSQMKALESWGDMERQHTSALSTTKDCLQATVCRLPLLDGAKAEPQHLSAALRQAKDVTATITTTINMIIPKAQNTVPLLSDLAHVIAEERSLLEECFESLRLVAALQIQEQSLKCHLIQLTSLQQRKQLKENMVIMIN